MDDKPVVYPINDMFKETQIQDDSLEKTVVGLTLSFRQKGQKAVRIVSGAVEYDGGMEEVIAEVVPQATLILADAPTMKDLGHKNVPGINSGQLYTMIEELSHYRRLGEEKFNQRRREIFEEIWQFVDKPDFEKTRQDVQDAFNHVIKRTFEAMDNRKMKLENTQEFIEEVEFRQNLS